MTQGSISGISSWDWQNLATATLTARPTKTTTPDYTAIQAQTYVQQWFYQLSECDSFSIDDDDYINGYRVIYNYLVYGLTFYTVKNQSFQCIAEDTITNIANLYDSGLFNWICFVFSSGI